MVDKIHLIIVGISMTENNLLPCLSLFTVAVEYLQRDLMYTVLLVRHGSVPQ